MGTDGTDGAGKEMELDNGMTGVEPDEVGWRLSNPRVGVTVAPAPEDFEPADDDGPNDAGSDEADGPVMDNGFSNDDGKPRLDIAGADDADDNVWLSNGSPDEMGKLRLGDAGIDETAGNEADKPDTVALGSAEFVNAGSVWLTDGSLEEMGKSMLGDAEIGDNEADAVDPGEIDGTKFVKDDGAWLSDDSPDETGKSTPEDAEISGDETDVASTDALGCAEFVKAGLASVWLIKPKLDVSRPEEPDDGGAEETGEGVTDNGWLGSCISDETGKATPDDVDSNLPGADGVDTAKMTGPGDNRLIEAVLPGLDDGASDDRDLDGMAPCDDGKPEIGNAEFVEADKAEMDSVGSDRTSPDDGGPDTVPDTVPDKSKFNGADTTPDGAELVDAGEAEPDDIKPEDTGLEDVGCSRLEPDETGKTELDKSAPVRRGPDSAG
ncbi:hypothetical protein E4U42_004691 [Claviceps africana]|uniref:Uncharacterized protein n=1 Tax=Claviceps africana TaxID=83212 RepID=A0A8K0J4M6_9HYPO|nr:hypothetical protein E4U42_004691 [Claviceps africana]